MVIFPPSFSCWNLSELESPINCHALEILPLRLLMSSVDFSYVPLYYNHISKRVQIAQRMGIFYEVLISTEVFKSRLWVLVNIVLVILSFARVVHITFILNKLVQPYLFSFFSELENGKRKNIVLMEIFLKKKDAEIEHLFRLSVIGQAVNNVFELLSQRVHRKEGEQADRDTSGFRAGTGESSRRFDEAGRHIPNSSRVSFVNPRIQNQQRVFLESTFNHNSTEVACSPGDTGNDMMMVAITRLRSIRLCHQCSGLSPWDQWFMTLLSIQY